MGKERNNHNNGAGGDCCSFCGAKRSDVEIMFQGVDGANICNKCIENGYRIMVENDVPWIATERSKGRRSRRRSLLKPAQIKDFLDQYVIGQDDAKALYGRGGLQPLQAPALCPERRRRGDRQVEHRAGGTHRERARP